MKEIKQKLIQDRPASYQVKVPGYLDERFADWSGEMSITVEYEEDGHPITILTGSLDLAALQGLLRRLYSLGLPIISVKCLEVE